MDTRFWGKSGWSFFHSIAYGYPKNPSDKDKEIYKTFFGCIKYVLPCIYCRNSFTEYTEKLSIDNYLNSNETLSKWLYLIHNMVNDKLRSQGFLHENDPSFEEIYHRYKNYVKEVNDSNCINMPGWDFIYCIFFNYPESISELLKESGRLKGYAIFILMLHKVLPFPLAQRIIKNNTMDNEIDLEDLLISRDKLKIFIYNIELNVKNAINCKCISFDEKCNYIEKYRASCKKNTCRINNGTKIMELPKHDHSELRI